MGSMEQKMNYRKPYSASAKNCIIITSKNFRILSYENMSNFLISVFYTTQVHNGELSTVLNNLIEPQNLKIVLHIIDLNKQKVQRYEFSSNY